MYNEGMVGCMLFQSGSSATGPGGAFFHVEAAQLKLRLVIGRAQDIHMKQVTIKAGNGPSA